jgi:hypothetical protein
LRLLLRPKAELILLLRNELEFRMTVELVELRLRVDVIETLSGDVGEVVVIVVGVIVVVVVVVAFAVVRGFSGLGVLSRTSNMSGVSVSEKT